MPRRAHSGVGLCAGALAGALAGLGGCAGGPGFSLSELPAAPLAVVYRPEEVASKRATAIKNMKERQEGGGGGDAEGVVRVENLDALFGGMPEWQRRLGELQGHLALVDPHTGSAKPIEGAPPSARPLAWSPDRSKLLLSGRWRDGAQLFAWEPANGGFEILTSGPHEHPMGCLGPDGRLVALELRQEGGQAVGRLMATPPGGGGLRPVTDGPVDTQPACSPIAPIVASVTIGDDGAPTILVRDLATPQIAHPVGHGVFPVFTPDGGWILYAAKTPQGHRLVRVRPDGTGRTAIGEPTVDESRPSASPDGRYLAYVVTADDGREKLWVRRFDGSGGRPFVGDGDAALPVW